MDNNTFNRAITQARFSVIENSNLAFYASLLLSLPIIEDSEIQTAQTNGKEIRVSPKFFLELPKDSHRVFLLLHETMHVAYKHICRAKDKDPKIWNYATDYVINNTLNSWGYHLPEGIGLFDKEYINDTAEQVYEKLLSKAIDLPNSPFLDLDGEAEVDEADIDDRLIQVAISSGTNKEYGEDPHIPAELKKLFQKTFDPQNPWEKILRKYITEGYGIEDYTFSKFNRMFPDIYIPKVKSEGIKDIAVFIDVSGSVSEEEVEHILKTVSNVSQAVDPERLYINTFNTRIRCKKVIKRGEPLGSVPIAGGGTSIFPVLDWIKTKKPVFSIIFTDGYFRMPSDYPKNTDIIWVIVNNPKFKLPVSKRQKIIHNNTKEL